MKRNWLLVSAIVLGLAAAANASSVSLAFDRADAEPGETVQLMITGDADTPADAVVIDLGFTSPGSYPEPAELPSMPMWPLSAVWFDPWDASTIGVDRSVDEINPDPLELQANAYDKDIDMGLDQPFDEGPIVTISMIIPDDGTLGFCDYIEVVVTGAEFARAGISEEVPEEGRGSASLHIIPEPTTISLLALGAFGALVRRRRR